MNAGTSSGAIPVKLMCRECQLLRAFQAFIASNLKVVFGSI
jgi:hypothetical protein